MSHRLSFLAVLSGLVLLVTAAAQPPYPLPESATDEELQQVVVPLSDAVRRRIEEALQRNQAGGPPASTGDPVLDDVLEVIRRQGSVLDGSSLDIQAPGPRPLAPQPPGFQGPGFQGPGFQGPGFQGPGAPIQRQGDQIDAVIPVPEAIGEAITNPPVPNFPTSQLPLGPDARFHVAESLLKAARELASLPDRDGASNRLVAAMREQATMLLIDEYSEDPNRFE
jgi:hypothetical protein